jgi:hypothetical protein
MPLALTLVTLSTRRDFGDDCLVERKFDSERSVARNASDAIRLDSHRKGAYDEPTRGCAWPSLRSMSKVSRWTARWWRQGEQTSFARLELRLVGVADANARRLHTVQRGKGGRRRIVGVDAGTVALASRLG